MNNQFSSIKKCDEYIEKNKVFVKTSWVSIIVAIVFFVIGYYWISWFKFLGFIILFAGFVDMIRQQGYRKGFINGYDEGVNDAYEKQKQKD